MRVQNKTTETATFVTIMNKKPPNYYANVQSFTKNTFFPSTGQLWPMLCDVYREKLPWRNSEFAEFYRARRRAPAHASRHVTSNSNGTKLGCKRNSLVGFKFVGARTVWSLITLQMVAVEKEIGPFFSVVLIKYE